MPRNFFLAVLLLPVGKRWTPDFGQLAKVVSRPRRTSLAFESVGTTYLAYVMMSSLKVATRQRLQEGWDVEVVDWGEFHGLMSLVLDPSGNPSISFQTSRDRPLGAGSDKIFRFARRLP